jgi:DNA-binding MarR family transcriptional regulator
MHETDDALRRAQEASFGHTLLASARLYDQRGQARLNAELGEPLARPAVMRLVPYVTAEGIRPTELARLTDVSKQAVGQTLTYLEERGLVEFAPDPSDGRAVLVRMTEAGREMSRRGLEALARVQREVEERVGAELVAKTLAGLRMILSALEDAAAADETRRHPWAGS